MDQPTVASIDRWSLYVGGLVSRMFICHTILYMCVCVCVCVCVCERARGYSNVHTYLCTFYNPHVIHTYVCTFMHACIYTFMYLLAFLHDIALAFMILIHVRTCSVYCSLSCSVCIHLWIGFLHACMYTVRSSLLLLCSAVFFCHFVVLCSGKKEKTQTGEAAECSKVLFWT